MLHIFLRIFKAHLRQARASSAHWCHQLRCHRHAHYRFRILDSVFEGLEDGCVRFCQARIVTSEELAAINDQVYIRMLLWFLTSRLMDGDNAQGALTKGIATWACLASACERPQSARKLPFSGIASTGSFWPTPTATVFRLSSSLLESNLSIQPGSCLI